MLSFIKLFYTFYTTLLISSVYAVPAFHHATANTPKTGADGLRILAKKDASLAPTVNLTQVDQVLGRPGVDNPDGVRRYSFPRTDLNVTLKGLHLKAGFALGGFAVFKLFGNTSVAMGDLVLTEDEVNPVLSTLQQEGIQQTALHNHLLFETPHVMYMHFKAEGDPIKVGCAISTALRLTKTPPAAPTSNSTSPLDLDTAHLDAVMGYHGKANNGIYQYSIPRAETIRDGNLVIPPAMGVSTVINFQPVGHDNAAITGDFTLIAKEVPLVLRVLSKQHIDVTALHNHMLTDSPHLFYIHFFANGNALELATGLRAALNQTNSKPSA